MNYPIQDDTWPSRRWNKERTEYIDLSGEAPVTPVPVNEGQQQGKQSASISLLILVMWMIYFGEIVYHHAINRPVQSYHYFFCVTLQIAWAVRFIEERLNKK